MAASDWSVQLSLYAPIVLPVASVEVYYGKDDIRGIKEPCLDMGQDREFGSHFVDEYTDGGIPGDDEFKFELEEI